MSKGFTLSVSCKYCGTLMKLRGQRLPNYKICPNCKKKNDYSNAIIRFHTYVDKGEQR